jgi:class 3 adenylate cyclase
LAEHIENARMVELDGDDHLYYAGDFGELIGEINSFVTGAPVEVEPNRVFAALLFTDIVDSTPRVASLGDAQWSDLLERHRVKVRTNLTRFNGREVGTEGDSFLATFDLPANAVRCARAIRDDVSALGIDLHIGIHAGEVEVRDDDLAGIALHIGARVSAHAQPGEVLVTETVVHLVAGSGIEFENRGSAQFKGVPEQWRVYAVA